MVAVVNDEEWRACCEVIERADLAPLDLPARQARHDALDDVLAAWAQDRDPQEAMETLQNVGVPAGRVLDSGEIHEDPQLIRRRFWVYLPNPKMIRYRQAGVSWRLVECNPTLSRHSPVFGEHTRDVLAGVGGLSDDEIDALYGRSAAAPSKIPSNELGATGAD